MSRARIDRLLNRLDQLFEQDPSNHDAIENTMETLARLAQSQPSDYREALRDRGEVELSDPDEERVVRIGNLRFRLRGVGVGDLPATAETFAGLHHANAVRERAQASVRPLGGGVDLDRGVWFPHDRDSLMRMLKQAGERDMRVSCAGSWRSFSDVKKPRAVPRPGDIILGTSFLNRALDATGPYYACEAGRAVWQITRDLNRRSQALINMGGGDFQTLGGAVSTGTHGSGRTLGDLATFVKEVDVCTLDANRDPVMKTLSGDQLKAAGVALGALGVVYSARFRVRQSYHLQEKRLLMPWTEAKALVRNHIAGRDRWRHLEVLVVPNPVPLQALRGKLHKRNLTTYRRRTDIPDTGTLAVVTLRKVVSAATASPTRQRPLAMQLARKGFGRWIAYQGLHQMLTGPQRIGGLLKSSMVRQRVDEFVGRWDEVLKLGLLLDATGAEFSVPAERAIRAAEIILAAAAERRVGGIPTERAQLEHMWRTRPMHTSPFALRFVRAGETWLSMAHGRDSCMIEMPMLQNPKVENAPEDTPRTRLYRAYRQGRTRLVDHVYGKLSAEFGGEVRPHWGLSTPTAARGEDWVRRHYPAWNEWKAVYEQFNLHGTFDSAFTDRMGISRRPR